MVDGGDIGALAGALAGGYFALRVLGKAAAYTTLGPAYVVGSTLVGLAAGHYIGHKLNENNLAAHH